MQEMSDVAKRKIVFIMALRIWGTMFLFTSVLLQKGQIDVADDEVYRGGWESDSSLQHSRNTYLSSPSSIYYGILRRSSPAWTHPFTRALATVV
jgi:hypothetical protein